MSRLVCHECLIHGLFCTCSVIFASVSLFMVELTRLTVCVLSAGQYHNALLNVILLSNVSFLTKLCCWLHKIVLIHHEENDPVVPFSISSVHVQTH